MVVLLAMISGGLTTIMLVVKQFESRLPPSSDPNEAANVQQRLDLFNLTLSLVLSLAGSLIIVTHNPLIFATDPPVFAENPILWAVFAGLISILPGGAGTSILSGILIWLGVQPPPPSAQTVTQVRSRRGSLLWR